MFSHTPKLGFVISSPTLLFKTLSSQKVHLVFFSCRNLTIQYFTSEQNFVTSTIHLVFSILGYVISPRMIDQLNGLAALSRDTSNF